MQYLGLAFPNAKHFGAWNAKFSLHLAFSFPNADALTSHSSLSLIYLSLSPFLPSPSITPSFCNISISNSSNLKPKYLPPPFSCCFPYLLSKFYFTRKFKSFIHQILFTTDLRFSKWGREIIHSHHSQQQSNCCTNERGWMGKKSRETKSFSLYFAKSVQSYQFLGWTSRFDPVFKTMHSTRC